MKNRKIIIGFIIAFFCLLLIETFIYLTYSNTQKDEVKISFIVTGDNLDEWESMKNDPNRFWPLETELDEDYTGK